MLNKLITNLTLWALKSHRITGEQKTKVMSALLENIGALPVRKIFSRDEFGGLIVNGRKIDAENAQALYLNLTALRDNPARKMLNDQKKFLAIEFGVHNGLNSEMIQFSKACLWGVNQDEELLNDILVD